MYDEKEKIEDIDTLVMYKMIQALLDYDFYSVKCLVNELLLKRKDKREIENLEIIQNLLFYQKNSEIKLFLSSIIENEIEKNKYD